MWRRLHDLPCSLIPCCTISGIFCLLFGEWFDHLWDTLRGEASMYAEPLEDVCILVRPFVPQDMWLGLSTAYSHHCCLVTYTNCQSVYCNILGYWMYPRFWFWRHKPCLLVLPFSTTARNLRLIDLMCCWALAWQLGGTLPCSLTRSASCWLILSWYLAVSKMGWVLKHKLCFLVLQSMQYDRVLFRGMLGPLLCPGY